MPVDPSPVIVCAETWRPRATWAATLRPAYEALLADERDARAWAEVAMMMGDTHAAPLALVVCLYAESVVGSGGRLASHRNLCLLDLGLAHAAGPVRIVELDEIAGDSSALEAWLARALIPFEGDLRRAAWFALRIACIRTAILDGSDPAP